MHSERKASPTISVIIPCQNERDRIEGCVRSILRQQQPDGGLEVIVADGMSGDGTREILQQLAEKDQRVEVIDNPGRIVSTGLNAAIRVAQGQIIVRVDVHTEYADDYVRQCVAVLEETGADNVGGPWVASGTGFIGRTIAAAFQSPFSFGGTRGHNADYEGPVDTVYLGCWPRRIFDRIGMFDERLVRNQDDEFNLRLTRSGGKVWQSPRIRSWYKPRSSFRELFNQYKQYGYWKVRVIQKHKTPASFRHLIPAGFVFLVLVLSLMSFWWSPATYLCFTLLGLYVLCNLLATVITAATRGWLLSPLLPLVFACFHLGYGLGFLRGVFDLITFRRAPVRYSGLTR